jgi:hypothetical protein
MQMICERNDLCLLRWWEFAVPLVGIFTLREEAIVVGSRWSLLSLNSSHKFPAACLLPSMCWIKLTSQPAASVTGTIESLGPCRADIFARYNDVVEVDGVCRILGPAIGDVGLQCECIGPERLGFAPIDASPMAEQATIDPERLFPVAPVRCVLLEHKLGADPAIFSDDLLGFGQE